MNKTDVRDTYAKTTNNNSGWTTNLRMHGKNRMTRPANHPLLTVVRKHNNKVTKTAISSENRQTRCYSCDALGHHKHIRTGLSYNWVCTRCVRYYK